jgi:GT2 family glycosyltransferase
MPYSRAWAFNVGARIARGEVIVLHDNDMLVAADYGRQIIERVRQSHEVINLKRFIFYVTASHSAKALSGEEYLTDCLSESVVQNLEGGGSIAITREAYFAIGGFDESFIGWGGEDNEFWERAQTRRVWPYGHLPFIHLWHPAQTDKFNQRRSTATLLEQRSAISPDARIAELTSREFGKLALD